MSEEATSETPAEEVEQQGGTDWKAEARKWESRAKENHAAVKERDSLTEQLESLRAENETVTAKVAEFEAADEHRGWVREVAEASGLPADVLRGDTKEALTAHAESLKPLVSSNRPGPVVDAQGKRGHVNVADPRREAVKNLFGSGD